MEFYAIGYRTSIVEHEMQTIISMTLLVNYYGRTQVTELHYCPVVPFEEDSFRSTTQNWTKKILWIKIYFEYSCHPKVWLCLDLNGYIWFNVVYFPIQDFYFLFLEVLCLNSIFMISTPYSVTIPEMILLNLGRNYQYT